MKSLPPHFTVAVSAAARQVLIDNANTGLFPISILLSLFHCMAPAVLNDCLNMVAPSLCHTHLKPKHRGQTGLWQRYCESADKVTKSPI